MITYGKSIKPLFAHVSVLALIFALLAPVAHAHGGGKGGGGHGGGKGGGGQGSGGNGGKGGSQSSGGNKGSGGGYGGGNKESGGNGNGGNRTSNNGNGGSGSNYGNRLNGDGENSGLLSNRATNSANSNGSSGSGNGGSNNSNKNSNNGGSGHKSLLDSFSKDDDSSYSGSSGDSAQYEYFSKTAKYYKSASSKSLALGIVTTAEGLGKMTNAEIKIGEGDTLVASGLESLKAGENFKKSEEEVLGKIKESATPKEVDAELMADPLAEEVLDHLAAKTGYSKAELIEKILNSQGSLDELAEQFGLAAERKGTIGLAKDASPEELEAILADSKSGELRKKINFSSLREALTTSAALAKKAPQTDWKKHWGQVATGQANIAAVQEAVKKTEPARAPASQPVFLNLGENLPSFDLEQSELEKADEASLFEKIHRKYAEIAPSMHRPR